MDVEVASFGVSLFDPFWLVMYCIKDPKMVKEKGPYLKVFLLVTVNFID